LTLIENFAVAFEYTFDTKTGIVLPVFDSAGVEANVSKVSLNVLLAHYKTYISDLAQIFFLKIFRPVIRNIAAFDDQALSVFDCSFDHSFHNRPHTFSEFVYAAFRSQERISASDEAHFQMVQRKIRDMMLFHKPLGHEGLSGV